MSNHTPALAYGIQLPIQSQSTYYVQDWEPAATPEDLATIARAADVSGYLYVAVCDHVAIPRERADGMSTTWYDTIATLGWLAGLTSNVGLLAHVYVPTYRHPLQVAKSWCTLDAVSGGRAILGVGAGHVEAEFDALGTDFGNRGAELDDHLEALSACFAEEFPTVENPSFSFQDLGMRPRPVQSGGPPIWVGGSSKPALRRAARFGQGWLPQGTPYDRMPEAVAYIQQHRETYGKTGPFEISVLSAFLHLGDTKDLPSGTFAGSPERIAKGLVALKDLGATQVQVRFVARSAAEYAEQVQAFGEQVGPALAAG